MTEELHVPTMGRIRDDFIEAWAGHFMDGALGAAEYFDQALHLHNARIEAAAEQRGAERALLRAEKLLKEDRAELGETVSTQLMIDWLRLLAGQPINHKEEDDERN